MNTRMKAMCDKNQEKKINKMASIDKSVNIISVAYHKSALCYIHKLK